MRKEYGFANAKPNPYFKKITETNFKRLDIGTIGYFKKKTEESA